MRVKYKVAPQVFDIPYSPRQRKWAIILSVFITVVSLITLPFGMIELPHKDQYLSAIVGCIIFGNLLTAITMYSQYRASGLPALLVIFCTYLFGCFMSLLYVLTFPSLFINIADVEAIKEQTAGWVWVMWHVGITLGIWGYAFVGRKWSAPLKSKKQIVRSGTAGIVLTLFLVFFSYKASMLAVQRLPGLFYNNDLWQLKNSMIGPILWALNMYALLVLRVRVKRQSVLHLWLSVAMLALLMEVTLELWAGMRFTLGWYVAKINSLISATIVLCAIVNEVNRLFIRLSEQHRQLIESEEQLEVANEQLLRLTNLDGLTEIPNRRRLDEILDRELQTPEERSNALSLLMIDIDYFKDYNDYYGHQAGDQVLKKVAQTIYAAAKRERGFAARYGGEEFVVILAGHHAQQTLELAERLRGEVAALAIEHHRSKVDNCVTISMGGYSLCPHEPMTSEELICHADDCLYQAKAAGRNRAIVKGGCS